MIKILQRYTSIAVLLTLGNVQQSRAGDLFSVGVDVNATAGLDEPTRRLIEGWPQEVRNQLLGLLKDALPLLKTDIKEYLAAVNEIIDRQIDHAQCAANGAVADMVDQLKHSVGGSLSPISDLRAARLKVTTKLGPSASPEAYSDSYSDLAYQAALTYCQVQISVSTREDASKLEAEYRKVGNSWARLRGNCTGVQECFNTIQRETNRLLANSDKRDVALVRGRERVKEVVEPARPTRIDRLLNSFDPSSYEQAMQRLFAVGDEVVLAKLQRTQRARELLSDATAKTLAASGELASAHQDLVPKLLFSQQPRVTILMITPLSITKVVDQHQVDAAQTHASAAESLCSQGQTEASQASILDVGLKGEAERVTAQIAGLRNDIATVKVARPQIIH